MELREAARRILGTHRRLIVVFVLLGILAAGLLHAGSQRTYTASTRLILDTPDPRDRSEAMSIADMAAAIATSPSEVQSALNDAHISTRDPEDIARHHVSIRALGSSAVLDLSVSDRNRHVATAVSNALATQVIRTRLSVSSGQLQQVLDDLDERIDGLNRKIATLDAKIALLGFTNAPARDAAERSRDILAQARGVLESERVSLLSTNALRPKPSVISRASVPTHADSSHLAQDLVLGALLGLVLGVGLAGLIETIRPTFVGSDVLAREFDTLLLGTLPGEPKQKQRQRDVSLLAARLHLAAESAGLREIVLLGTAPDMGLPRLAERLETGPADVLRTTPDGAKGGPAGKPAAVRKVRGDAAAVDGTRPDLRVRTFDLHSSQADGRDGTGIVLVSSSTLQKAKVDEVGHLLDLTRSPVLGLITYDGSRPASRGSQPKTRPRSGRNLTSRDRMPQVRTWAKGASARLRHLQHPPSRS